jgi:hypothetical protein
MTPSRLLLGASVLFASIGLHATQQPPATPPPAGAPPPGAPAARGGQPGRGGGRGNPMAAKFTEVCASCHGTSTAKGPVGPSLFDDEWVHGGDDESIVKSIRDGYPEKGMPPFKDALNDQQTWQMVAYIRTQAANLKEKPVYVPDPDGQIVKSEKQTFKMEIVARNLETPWALAFLPDGRLLVTERPGRIRIIGKDGRMEPEPAARHRASRPHPHYRQGRPDGARAGQGAAKGVGEAGRRPLRRRGPS